MKKSVLIALLVLSIIFISIVSAQKLDVTTTKETFGVGENITFKVSLYDSQNLPIDAQVNVTFENPNKIDNIELTVPTNRLSDASLGDKASSGPWKIIARYEGIESNSLFSVEENELLRISMQGDMVTIKNIGNTRFTKEIYILIGDNIVIPKEIELDIGQETSFRLLAPDGIYNVKITAGKTTPPFIKSDVRLTGEAIGTLDERMADSTNLLTGINPAKETGAEKASSNLFVYIFIMTILGTAVLVAVERHYRKKI